MRTKGQQGIERSLNHLHRGDVFVIGDEPYMVVAVCGLDEIDLKDGSAVNLHTGYLTTFDYWNTTVEYKPSAAIDLGD